MAQDWQETVDRGGMRALIMERLANLHPTVPVKLLQDRSARFEHGVMSISNGREEYMRTIDHHLDRVVHLVDERCENLRGRGSRADVDGPSLQVVTQNELPDAAGHGHENHLVSCRPEDNCNAQLAVGNWGDLDEEKVPAGRKESSGIGDCLFNSHGENILMTAYTQDIPHHEHKSRLSELNESGITDQLQLSASKNGSRKDRKRSIQGSDNKDGDISKLMIPKKEQIEANPHVTHAQDMISQTRHTIHLQQQLLQQDTILTARTRTSLTSGDSPAVRKSEDKEAQSAKPPKAPRRNRMESVAGPSVLRKRRHEEMIWAEIERLQERYRTELHRITPCIEILAREACGEKRRIFTECLEYCSYLIGLQRTDVLAQSVTLGRIRSAELFFSAVVRQVRLRFQRRGYVELPASSRRYASNVLRDDGMSGDTSLLSHMQSMQHAIHSVRHVLHGATQKRTERIRSTLRCLQHGGTATRDTDRCVHIQNRPEAEKTLTTRAVFECTTTGINLTRLGGDIQSVETASLKHIVQSDCTIARHANPQLLINLTEEFGRPLITCQHLMRDIKLPKLRLRVLYGYPSYAGLTIAFGQPPLGWIGPLGEIRADFENALAHSPHRFLGIGFVLNAWAHSAELFVDNHITARLGGDR